MTPVSDTIELPNKPDPDYCHVWYNHNVTQWYLANLKKHHQSTIEELASLTCGDIDTFAREAFKLQALAEALNDVISDFENIGGIGNE